MRKVQSPVVAAAVAKSVAAVPKSVAAGVNFICWWWLCRLHGRRIDRMHRARCAMHGPCDGLTEVLQ